MLAPDLTLAAALRDSKSTDDRFRYQAAENLARALLFELRQPGPRWRAAAEHPQGEAVLEALRGLLSAHEPAVLRGAAAVGLSMLGEAAVLELTTPWLRSADGGDAGKDDEDAAYLRESAIMAAARLHRAATEADTAPELRHRIEALVEDALRAEPPDLRYQAAQALVELGGSRAEAPLARALREEEHPAVREGMVEALSLLDPPGPAACEVLEELLRGPEGVEGIGFEAAMTLAAARRSSARSRLLAALAVRHQRDRALEALAALGRTAPAPTTEQVEVVVRLGERLWLPGVTRVRAAYALARMVPAGDGDNPGVLRLLRLRWHPRPAVREAVRDAFTNLEQLAARESGG
ncbi:HEAT repeat domain-containing protein [Paraliomyxa miuraensis]|uniref:HEAT repeat domain-containing protein n=1 Tax=Paraliomyxa miuraensis TaxID=376150 RepID=UPI002255A046|nr:HEAT repeat domain-containing protein [Paraliomyxa miuraensis]MCX4239821.1 HEAT repeat domain-containing protein [Paraliomyxa miuraensis]